MGVVSFKVVGLGVDVDFVNRLFCRILILSGIVSPPSSIVVSLPLIVVSTESVILLSVVDLALPFRLIIMICFFHLRLVITGVEFRETNS